MATTKKTIEPQKKWWTKNLEKTGEILKAAGLAGKYEHAFKGIWADINIIFMKNSSQDSYIRKSVILNAFKRTRNYRNKLLETMLNNKWLFYSQDIDMGTDALIQPIFNMEKITESKLNALLNAITYNNFEKVKKLVPNVLTKFEKYSCCLFKEEEVNTDSSDSFHNSLSSAPARDGSELITRKTASVDTSIDTSIDTSVDTSIDTSVDTSNDATPIISTRDANKREKENKKKNKSFNQSKEENRNLLGENETGLLSFSDKKTDYETDTAGTLEEYVNGLKLGSKEVESLFNFAGDEAEFFLSNFDKFKLKFLNRSKLLGKDKELDAQSHEKKNLYLYNLLRKPAFRKELVKDIQECLVFKIKTEFRYHKEGYKWDLFNKDGDRMSQGKIIPKDAPPQPSPDHFWDFDYNMWVH